MGNVHDLPILEAEKGLLELFQIQLGQILLDDRVDGSVLKSDLERSQNYRENNNYTVTVNKSNPIQRPDFVHSVEVNQ